MLARLALLVLVAASCTPVAHAEDSPGEQFEHDMMVRFHMHENFGLLRAIEKLLIRGKLEEATALARSIADAPDEPGLGAFAAQATKVRESAAALARATTVDDACHRAAQLAVACAGCHADTRVVPELSSLPAVPPDKDNLEARMARHLWATDRLWEATVGGGDEPWKRGLDVLTATPLPFAGKSDDRAELARRLQRLAKTARQRASTETLADRGTTYGEILATCASCHTSPSKAASSKAAAAKPQ